MQAEPDPRIRAYRAEADRLQELLDIVNRFSELPAPNVTGDARRFPRPAPQDELAAQGLTFLREDIARAVAVLNATATVLERQGEMPDVTVPDELLRYVEQRYRFQPRPPGQQTEGTTTPTSEGPEPETSQP